MHGKWEAPHVAPNRSAETACIFIHCVSARVDEMHARCSAEAIGFVFRSRISLDAPYQSIWCRHGPGHRLAAMVRGLRRGSRAEKRDGEYATLVDIGKQIDGSTSFSLHYWFSFFCARLLAWVEIRFIVMLNGLRLCAVFVRGLAACVVIVFRF